jgi:hypothetical protein
VIKELLKIVSRPSHRVIRDSELYRDVMRVPKSLCIGSVSI